MIFSAAKMNTTNSTPLSKIQYRNIRNGINFRTQSVFPNNSFLYSSCSAKNGGTLTLTFSFRSNKTVFSKLKTSENQNRTKGKKNISQVPTTTGVEAPEPGGSGGGPVNPPPQSKKSGYRKLKGFPKKVLAILSNLPLAIAEMFAVAALMALGTLVPQGEAPDFYFGKYPEDNPALGFLTWRWILTLGFDHMFSSPIFLVTLSLLGASLMACTYTTQIPIVKVAKRWSFLQSAEAIRKQEFSDTLPRASIKDTGLILMGAGYEVFLKGPSLYAFKGLAGRFAPIGVHLALLLIMSGGTLSATGSFRGSVTVPQGLNFVIGDVLTPIGFLSTPSESFNTEVHVNRYGGVTIYQTDWSLSALQIMKDDEGPFNLALAPLKINGDKKLYGTFLPVGDTDSTNLKGISMLARDMQSIVLYDLEGKFAGVRRPNSKLPIDIDGIKIVVLEAIGSTGLELKIWALQDGTTVVIGGKTNRAKGEFSDEMNFLLDQVPELVNSSGSKQPDTPAILTTVAQFSIGFVTIAFVGHLGEVELAAVSVVQNVLEGFVYGIMLGMGSALETLCGQAVGAGQHSMLGVYMQRSCIITMITALFLTPLYIFTKPILIILRQDEKISDLAGKYALWVIPQLFAYALNFPVQKFLQAQSKIWVMTIISIVVLGFHVFLNWIFVVRLDKGMFGAAIAENVSWWLVVLGQIVYIVAGFFPESWTGFSLTAFNMNLELWTLMITLGFNAAISVRVSNELGANHPRAAKFSVLVAVIMSTLFGIVFTVAIIATKDHFPILFSDKQEVIKETSKLGYFLAATIFLNSIQPVLQGVAVGAVILILYVLRANWSKEALHAEERVRSYATTPLPQNDSAEKGLITSNEKK
ncbi:cytochrome c biogenesis protein ccs1 chloroplastic [Phtheirospermum japonicum]|uniref:Protein DETOXIFICATION n=1 Tax=Phtheirospermum japonicum TaxID=374723 RepID=A0A830D1T6_9LAMI|nr:cytochrome c biogenesis protein ccs1 chloroplastic [Phtheirospermum japonicum]